MSLPPQGDEPFDQPLFHALDQYLESLHRSDFATSSKLARDPRLADWIECLHALDALAVPPHLHEMPAVVPSENDPSALERFGKFELVRELGRGGMGVVYLAHQQDLGRSVALKMILSSRLASSDDVRRFYAEARTAAQLRHPNIVGIHEVGELHGQHFFVMDFIEGQTLRESIRSEPLEPERAARIIATVARAVHYLHEHNIVHRDLKPSNILLDAHSTPYVTDFGLAKLLDADADATRSGTIIGTPSYMPPEQAAGHVSQISPQSDIYSLGAILYELLTGRPPFRHEHPLDTLVDVLEGEPLPPTRANPAVPPALEHVVLRCLEKDPHDRYETAAALADDLERFLRDEPVAAQPPSLRQRFQRWLRREPALASRVLGLGLAAAIVQGYYMLSGFDFWFHVEVMNVFAAWALLSFAFQKLLPQERFAGLVRYAWGTADATALTTLLFMADGPIGPLLLGYGLLIVASGLFFQVRLVWFTTLICLLAYAVLLVARGEAVRPWHYPVIFAAGLAVLGFMVAYQVHRVRALSRYYEHRPLP